MSIEVGEMQKISRSPAITSDKNQEGEWPSQAEILEMRDQMGHPGEAVET